ncbi:MAG TPA: Rieske 2Fe-2S domain-containing protein [Candidatus Dormibacteraeota bacterium]|jgi:nitrite reductase/ring-hydroxylating ferredoxin subunit/uncharacterized membrane protein|nr:Rieske 2Fe-2S domain-containing protein [Candidatus Dormibacteraeota bacterium]
MADSPVDRLIRAQGWLEALGTLLQGAVGGVYGGLRGPGRLAKDLAHGSRLLGHPLHPALTDVPLGAWFVAVVADLVALLDHAFPTQAGDLALAVGLVTGLGAVITGLTDHHETYGHELAVATAHGVLMVLVMALMFASLLLRWFAGLGLHGLAVALAVLGLLLALGAAYLGGHLSFGLGTMVNRNAFTEGPEEYVTVGRAEDFVEGEPRAVLAGGVPVLVVRQGGRLFGIADTCSHAGGPLHEGTLRGDVVTCPWHGSRFCVRDGSVRGGPATFAQPVFEVREHAGAVEVRRARALV